MTPAPYLLLPISSLYAGLCGILYLVLTVAVIRMRRKMKIPYGDGGQRLLKKRISAHSNASEYMPLFLLLIALLEAGGSTSAGLLHLYGLLILVGRLFHAYTVALDGTSFQGRVMGMILTVSALAFTSTHLLCKALYAQLR